MSAVSFSPARWWPLLLAAVLAVPVTVPAARRETFPGLSRQWAYYQSPNFELYSTNSERASRDVLEKMELLRAVFLDTFRLTVRLPQPVTIYYFGEQDDFNGYLPKSRQGGDVEWAGFCHGDFDRTVITLAPARDRDGAREVVYHEYVHYLFRITEQNPATWYNEGVAELFSTMEEDDEWLQLGQPVVGRVNDLRHGRMMPFEQLFAVTQDSPVFRSSGHTGIFYAQSWAFLHYCRFGDNRIPPEKMALFLRAAASPKAQEKPEQFRVLCKELLGYDYPRLLEVLQHYITDGRFQGRKVHRPAIAPKASYVARPATTEEMTARLAELSLRFTQSAYANWAIHERVAKQPDSRLHELLGTVAMQENETDVAREHWSNAVDLGTTNASTFRELSRLEANRVFSQFDLDYRLPDERAARLRSLLRKSVECAPEQSMGYEMLAWVEATANAPEIATINLVQQRFKTLNDKPRTLLALAMVRFRRGETQPALEMLDQLDKMNPNEWTAYGAEITRARLEKRPVNREKLNELTSRQTEGFKLVPPNLDPPR